MAKSEAEYQEWVKELRSKLPEDKRRLTFDAILDAPEGKEVFGGHMAEKEFYRRLNKVTDEQRAAEQAALMLAGERAQFQQDVAAIDAWYQNEKPKNRRLMAERSALQAEVEHYQERLRDLGLEDEVRRTPSVEANKVLKSDSELREEIDRLKAEVRQQINQMDQATVRVLADYGAVLTKLQKDGFDVDPRKLIEHSTTKRVDLFRAYEDLTAGETWP